MTPPRAVFATFCGVVFLLASAAPATALLIEDARPDEAGGQAILWVRDCGKLARDIVEKRQCAPREKRFSKGDAQELDIKLGRRRYDEVWLFSGGGLSDEGFRVGRILRKHQMTVRVRSGASCVSACTVAFLGGWFRFIDAGGSYEVHSASAWADGFSCDEEPECEAKETLEKIRKNPAEAFVLLAAEEQISARYIIRRRLIHFQNTLLQPLGERVREGDDVDAQLIVWAKSYRPALTYADSAQLKEDVRRFESEGESAAQDILMRIERDSMRNAIADLRAIINTLGKRAEPALRMIEVMTQTSILDTSILSDATLLRMGFITKLFEPRP